MHKAFEKEKYQKELAQIAKEQRMKSNEDPRLIQYGDSAIPEHFTDMRRLNMKYDTLNPAPSFIRGPKPGNWVMGINGNLVCIIHHDRYEAYWPS